MRRVKGSGFPWVCRDPGPALGSWPWAGSMTRARRLRLGPAVSGGGAAGLLGAGVLRWAVRGGFRPAEVGAGEALGAGGFGAVAEAGVLGEPEGLAGEDAEDEGARGRRRRGRGRRGCVKRRVERAGRATSVGGAGVDGGEQAQVVEAGDAGVEQADDGEPDVAGVDGGGEDVELAEEAAGEGDADQREQEEGEQGGEHGALRARPVKSSMRAGVLVVAGDLGDDGEGADVHGGVGGGVEAGGGDAVARGRR